MKLISSNKKAKYDYFLSDDLEVGIVLKGSEIKDILENGINLKETYVKIINEEMFLIGANITGKEGLNLRDRKLLLHKREIRKFEKKLIDGFTLIMKDMYVADSGKVKGTLCLAKGKKNYDKRQTIKERDLDRAESYK